MHIAEGVLRPEVLAAGAGISAVGLAVGIRRMDAERVPQVAVLSSALFVASLIHVPVPPTSVHLVLTGLAGIILGWTVFPAMLVALLLQAVFFGHGGLTTLGVNTLNMALPGVVCWGLLRRRLAGGYRASTPSVGFTAGALGIALGCAMWAATMATAGRAFATVAGGLLAAHVPVMGIEGLVTAAAVSLLAKVRPEILAGGVGRMPVEERNHA
jgi:cobalt/nickel transport system permease protein